MQKSKSKVAVIGGGIFGATAAALLGKHFSVTLFERHSDLLCEASRKNQYRHHEGFHYPRSPETIKEIKKSRRDFVSFYGKAIMRGRPAYYCVSKDGSKVSSSEFLGLCKKMGLWHKIGYPPKEFLNRDSVDVCVRTREAFYDYKKLKQIARKKMKKAGVVIKLRREVVGGHIAKDEKKILSIKTGNKITVEKFDYVINATYANYNSFCEWFGFSAKKLELRLKEVILIRMPSGSPCAVMVIDGPFATIVPTARKNVFTFGDAPLSIREIGKSGEGAKPLEIKMNKLKTLWPEMRERCAKWFPILLKAKRLESMFVILPVEFISKGSDARPTEVIYHGHGSFSVLSGKIVSSVSAAKDIFKKIQRMDSSRKT